MNHPLVMNFVASLVPQGLLQFLAFHSTIVFCALIIILVLAVFVWAAFLRKPSGRRSARHHWKSDKTETSDKNAKGPDSPPKARRRHKRRRPRKPLNPTLAETRGLPPVRDKQSTPPPAY
jgi:hypothetical protein